MNAKNGSGFVFALTLALIAGAASAQDALVPAAAGDPFVNVTGAVTDANNQAVPDAQVYLTNATMTGAVQVLTTQTDAKGLWSFKLKQEPKTDLVVLVSKKGHALGIGKKHINVNLNASGQIRFGETIDLPIQLGKPKRLTLRVVDDRGAPVRGARLGTRGIWPVGGGAYFYWNDNHVPALTWETGADGNVTLEDLPASHSIGLLVQTPDLGTQIIGIDLEKAAAESVVSLLPVCRVEVALSSKDASLLNERDITIDVRAPEVANPEVENPTGKIRPWGGQARIRTDSAGRAGAVVVAGTFTVSVDSRANDQSFPKKVTLPQGTPGQTISLTIPFQSGTKLKGRVKTPDDEPVADVAIRFGEGEVRSQKDGAFEVWVAGDQNNNGQVSEVPDGFTLPYERQIYLPAPAPGESAKAEREIPPIILRKSAPISGRVIDETGQPVSGARVVASWVQQHESAGYFTLKSDVAASDALGRFKLSRVFPDVDVIVSAETVDKCVLETIAIHSTKPQDLQLTVTPVGMVSIVGTAKGAEGSEVSNATVKVVRSSMAPGGHNYGSRLIEWNGHETFAGQRDGTIHSPGKVPRFGKYSVTISAPGYLALETPFVAALPSSPTLDLGETKLTKARVIAGIVRDSSGAPLPGAEVWSWAAGSDGGRSYMEKTTAKTDEAGRFTLDKVHPVAALAFVNKDGFRLTGCALFKGVSETSVILFRADEAIPAEGAVQPTKFDDARRSAAAEKLMKGVLQDQQNSRYFHREVLSILAKANPAAARKELGSKTSADTRSRILAQLGEIQDALAEVESVNDAYSRAYCRFDIADCVQDANEVRDILAAALLDAQAIVQPDHRIVVVANVVDRFSRLGDHERVDSLLRDELPRAEALSTKEWPGFARGYFAAQLARTQPQIALRMASEAAADDQARIYQNIAHVIAGKNPDIAQEALRRIGKHLYVDDPSVRVAYRMAAVDVQRAIKLFEPIDEQMRPVEKARGLGVIAWAIRKSDQAQAREILERAFASIPRQLGGAGSRSDDLFGAGLELLRLAEDIDPERVTDYFWMAASLHPGPTGGAWSPDESPRSDAERQARLALLLSQYNASPKLPEQILEPVFEYWEKQIGTDAHHFTDHEGTFISMSLADPERTADWALRFHNKLNVEHRKYIPQPWEVIGKALTNDRRSIGESITREVFHRWVIDQYDF